MNLINMIEELAKRTPQPTQTVDVPMLKPRCYDHSHDLPCPQCDEDKSRGWSVKQLAGRCANGFQRDSGVRWHAVRSGEYKAICGATYGRRSAGWSSYAVIGQEVTCPKCKKKLEARLVV